MYKRSSRKERKPEEKVLKSDEVLTMDAFAANINQLLREGWTLSTATGDRDRRLNLKFVR